MINKTNIELTMNDTLHKLSKLENKSFATLRGFIPSLNSEQLAPDIKDTWQQGECLRLGITVEEHNEVLEMVARGLFDYDAIINALDYSSKIMENFLLNE